MRNVYLSLLYQEIAYKGRYIYLDGSGAAKAIQQQLHIDTIVQTSESNCIAIEEKIRRRYSNDILIETQQNTLTGAQGWIYTSVADILAYCYQRKDAHLAPAGLDVVWLNFPKLQEWFLDNRERYEERIGNNSANLPAFYLIPLNDLQELRPRYYRIDFSVQEIDAPGQKIPAPTMSRKAPYRR